jgi:hypothetical protein
MVDQPTYPSPLIYTIIAHTFTSLCKKRLFENYTQLLFIILMEINGREYRGNAIRNQPMRAEATQEPP